MSDNVVGSGGSRRTWTRCFLFFALSFFFWSLRKESIGFREELPRFFPIALLVTVRL